MINSSVWFRILVPLDNRLALGICIAIGVYAAASFLWLLWKSWRVTREIRQLLESSDSSLDYLRKPYDKYRQTVNVRTYGDLKTTTEASTYLGGDRILESCFNVRYWQSLPGILVGVGILGTFVGLAYGLTDFNTDDIERSIETLLGGMATAFATSIWGMSLALCFGLYEKYSFSGIVTKASELCSSLDSRFRLSGQLYVRNDFVGQEDGAEISPADVLRDIRFQLSEQTQALKSFSTDLADGIRISSQTISAFGEEIGKAIKVSVESSLAPSLDQLNQAITELRHQKEESSGQFLSSFVEGLQTLTQQLRGDFAEAFTGAAEEQIDRLADLLKEVKESLSTLPDRLETAAISLEMSSNSTTETVNSCLQMVQESIKELTDKTREIHETESDRLRENHDELARIIREKMKETTGEIGGIVKEFRGELGEALQAQQKWFEQIQAAAERVGYVFQEGVALAETFEDLSSNLNAPLADLKTVSQSFDSLMQNLDHCTQNLLSSTHDFAQQNERFLSGQRTLAEEQKRLSESTDETVRLASSVGREYVAIREGLREIFQEINRGLEEYQQATRDQLNKTLTALANDIQQAVSALKSSIDDLTDIAENLQEAKDRPVR